MTVRSPDDISGLLLAWSKGDQTALNDLMLLVYEDLRGIARRHLKRQKVRQLLQSGTLAHEAYLRLVQARGIRCHNRAHFFALCSQMLRQILVDHAQMPLRQTGWKTSRGAVGRSFARVQCSRC
jgi:hypothetical protein